MPLQLALQEAAEVEGAREGIRGRAQGQDPVRIDGLEAHSQLLRRRRGHARQEEGGGIVGHDAAGTVSEVLEQPLAGAGLRLDVGVVQDARAVEGASVLAHAVDHEAMQAVARPRVAAAQGLEHDQGPVELARQLDGAVQGEVPARAARGDHPVQDVLTVGSQGRVVEAAHPDRGNAAGVRGRAHEWLRSISSLGCGSK